MSWPLQGRLSPRARVRTSTPEGLLYYRRVADQALCNDSGMDRFTERETAIALPDLLSTAGILPLVGPFVR